MNFLHLPTKHVTFTKFLLLYITQILPEKDELKKRRSYSHEHPLSSAKKKKEEEDMLLFFFSFFFKWIIRARYSIKEGTRGPREYTGRIQRGAKSQTKGKKAQKQKTNQPTKTKLGNTQNISNKRVLHIVNQASPRRE